MKNLKSLIFGLAALVVAFGLVFSVSAFRVSKPQNIQEYYWYSADGLIPMGYGENPDGGCAETGVGCAKAYPEEQELPANGHTTITRGFN